MLRLILGASLLAFMSVTLSGCWELAATAGAAAGAGGMYTYDHYKLEKKDDGSKSDDTKSDSSKK
jgi:hypothetical protein